ncbi:MAG: hypothetical protein GF400_09755 [Candidatus Eisenbacteria bacterium]|nr:hypothetical protein [Candidatus Eisenbacteria bacterium]
MSYSCRTGAVDFHGTGETEPWRCLGERLLHSRDRTGAIAYFGASENARDISWEGLGKYVWEALFLRDHGQVGPAATYARLKFLARYGDFHEARIYNLLGDPALDIMQTDQYQSVNLDFAVVEEGVYTLPLFPSYGDSIQLCAGGCTPKVRQFERRFMWSPAGLESCHESQWRLIPQC